MRIFASMDRTERFYRIAQLIEERGVVPFADLLTSLEVSRATLKRDLEYLRDRLNAPIIWDREARGYRMAQPKRTAERRIRRANAPNAEDRFELPGLWFNSSEVHALLAMQGLLDQIEPGLLTPHIAPLKARLGALLGGDEHAASDITRRIRILSVARRQQSLKHFETAAAAVLGQRRLVITHHNRQRDETSEREVSPQRLIHYRDNWYLDAWCHLRNGLRTFSIDGISAASLTDKPAKALTNKALDEYLVSGYGIFGGSKVRWATLRFTALRARWVAHEAWHPEQKGRWLPGGSYELKLPYAEDPELIADILKQGAEVEVVAPTELRAKVAAALKKAAALYE